MSRAGLGPSVVAGVVLLALVVAAVVVGPLAWRVSPTDQDLLATLAPPTGAHPLGTDQYGRDVLARVLWGGRTSLATAVAALAASVALGSLAGWIASERNLVGGLITRLVDVLLAMPAMVVALCVVGALGIGVRNLALAFVLVGWPFYARIVRGLALERAKALDVHAARAFGVGGAVTFRRHVLPHVLRTLLIVAALDLGYLLGALSGFSYLGLGVQAPAPEWGAILHDAQMFFPVAPWLLVGPAAAIGITVLACILLTEDAHRRGAAR